MDDIQFLIDTSLRGIQLKLKHSLYLNIAVRMIHLVNAFAKLVQPSKIVPLPMLDLLRISEFHFPNLKMFDCVH